LRRWASSLGESAGNLRGINPRGGSPSDRFVTTAKCLVSTSTTWTARATWDGREVSQRQGSRSVARRWGATAEHLPGGLMALPCTPKPGMPRPRWLQFRSRGPRQPPGRPRALGQCQGRLKEAHSG
jgi:hypothetical protein